MGLTTWLVTGNNLVALSKQLEALPGVDLVAIFGNVLHVSGKDPKALTQAITPFQTAEYTWTATPSSLEDVFIYLVDQDQRYDG